MPQRRVALPGAAAARPKTISSLRTNGLPPCVGTLISTLGKSAAPNSVRGTHSMRARRDRANSPGENAPNRSEEHTSELQSLMRISYAVFCLKKKKQKQQQHHPALTELRRENATNLLTNLHSEFTILSYKK